MAEQSTSRRKNNKVQNQPPQQVMNLLDSMQISTSGAVVKLNLSIPETDLENLVGPAHGTMKNARHGATPAGKGVH